MKCPSRNDNTEANPRWNQKSHALSEVLATRADLNGIDNPREQREIESSLHNNEQDQINTQPFNIPEADSTATKSASNVQVDPRDQHQFSTNADLTAFQQQRSRAHGCHSSQLWSRRANAGGPSRPKRIAAKISLILQKYVKFIGPGFMISVAYIDPGNYATDVQAGADTRYRHLFVILLSNLFAIFLQSLCIKLGSVTGLDLAENCRKHLPKRLNILLYLFAEAAIIATDIAEVIGSAIALNLLLHIPLVAGCAITLVDVLILLLFYRSDGSMTRLRLFEYFVMSLVLGVMVCFCIQLSYIRDTTAGQVFKGYLPSAAVVEGNGIYLSCGIMGATVMPHSIFLGSGVVQPRLRQFDEQNGHTLAVVGAQPDTTDYRSEDEEDEKYRPSIHAIRACLKYSIFELASSLFTFALFVNSAILIVSGASLYPSTAASDADLFGIHRLLSRNLSSAAGTLFALALLLSGTSAGIVCTMAGQVVSEGMLHWTIKPWMRRLVTRSISIVPSIVIAGAIGREGLNQALTASQVVLSVILPFVTAPLVWFTSRGHVMTVPDGNGVCGGPVVNMRNGWVVTALAVIIWLVLVVMNVALLVLVGSGKA